MLNKIIVSIFLGSVDKVFIEAKLVSTVWPRMTFNYWSSCFYLPDTQITGIHLHIWFVFMITWEAYVLERTLVQYDLNTVIES